MTWRYVGRLGAEARRRRLWELSHRMFERHLASYERQVREGVYDPRSPEMIKARYWLKFAQDAASDAEARRRLELRFSTDLRWYGLLCADEFDAVRAQEINQ